MHNPTLSVLISCMHQPDASIIYRTNIQSDVIVVNQCDRDSIEEFDFINKVGEKCHAKFICTTERGLSRSRNMAIKNSSADICLLCDDDEIFVDNYPDIIKSAYNKHTNISLITFNVKCHLRTFPSSSFKMNWIKALKVASWQISFRRKDILGKDIFLDETMGAGVTMGAGEENKFVIDCIKHGLKGIYLPAIIGEVKQEETTWDLTPKNCHQYFHDRGEAYAKLMGIFRGSLYILYSSLRKKDFYRTYLPLKTCIKLQLNGLWNAYKKS